MTNLIEKFYSSFTNLDWEGMNSCYHDDVVFTDPAFGKLEAKRAKAMWQMLCSSQQGKDFTVTYSDVSSENDSGSAKWEAHYEFSKTGRRVHNKVQASFKLRDGLIIEHTDHFSLYNWSKQALGLSGTLIGWTEFFKKKLQNQTNGMLDKFLTSHT